MGSGRLSVHKNKNTLLNKLLNKGSILHEPLHILNIIITICMYNVQWKTLAWPVVEDAHQDIHTRFSTLLDKLDSQFTYNYF